MRLGKLAILFTIAAAALQCSGNPPVSEPGKAALDVPASVVVNAMDHTATPSGTQVVLHGNYPFSFTTYQPDAHTLIVELLEVRAQGMADEVRLDTPQVQGMTVSNVQGVDGGNIAKFEFRQVQTARHDVRLEGNDLVIDFPTLSDAGNLPEEPLVAATGSGSGTAPGTDASAAPAGDSASPATAPGTTVAPSPADSGSSAPMASAGTAPKGDSELNPIAQPLAAEKPSADASRPTSGPAPKGSPARSLVSVTVGTGHEAKVELVADGALREEHFELKNPPRLVIDLVGVVDHTKQKTIAVQSDAVTRVRVAQFASRPQPVARVVLDLSGPKAYGIEPTAKGLIIEFSEEAARRAADNNAPAAMPIAAPLAAEKPAADAGGTSPSSDAPSAEPAPSADTPAPAPTQTSGPAGTASVSSGAEPAADENAPAPEPSPKLDSNPLLAQGDVKIEKRPKEVPFRSTPARSGGETTLVMAQRSETRAISDTGPHYTGKRISLNFKDADLKDVFRLFHEITGYNIVLDPAVAGSLTIVLENVPEDQALDIILKNNGLDKVFENNVVRIASTQKLAQEAASRKSLLEAQELEQEPITFTRKLSYAKAKDAVPIIKKIMSKRGDVIMDDRTNTLIITDLLDRKEPISRLIDNLDEQTPQVTIEARIVETDREFERDLGIKWGVHGIADNATGTQTNWAFPHTGTVGYDVNLPAAATAGSLGINFGNVLDTFKINATLDAFELNGDVKVLSAPRIATQNNQKATIEQGTQIPVVSTTATQINVEFISASLKLEVTPQITREGTIIMDLKVDNSSPDFVNRVGDVPPILTERASTQILVTDGGTAVIGGIFKLNDSVTQAGVPGLSKIPGLGWLFRNKSVNRKNTELLIFITPRITRKAGAQEDKE
jgi:type IV pilus assembly protein PilQ